MKKTKSIIYAFLAAAFYAVNIPASKVLLREVGPAMMAALLYLGAGTGIAILSLAAGNDRKKLRDSEKQISLMSSE
jgi:drug/metabolite transporter (DMT)-like permease